MATFCVKVHSSLEKTVLTLQGRGKQKVLLAENYSWPPQHFVTKGGGKKETDLSKH